MQLGHIQEQLTVVTHKDIGGMHVCMYACMDLFIFREGGREGGRAEGKHQCVTASLMPPTGDLTCNPGLCPD